MSAADQSMLQTRLQESIRELVAAAVARAREQDQARIHELENALAEALQQLEHQQRALADTIATLSQIVGSAESNEGARRPSDPDEQVNAAEPDPIAEQAPTFLETDIIAHQASIDQASGLQIFLRNQPAINHVMTREFVDGELRLQVQSTHALEADFLTEWMSANSGKLRHTSPGVIEISFGA